MSKRVYISADYDPTSGDAEVAEIIRDWGKDFVHKTDFVDTAQVSSGSVSESDDCRACDLKKEFNRQINASSVVIIIIGDKTASRTAGSGCERAIKDWPGCMCTPYKKNYDGQKMCKIVINFPTPYEDVDFINDYSYIRHEFEQAKKKEKQIIVLYNSLKKEPKWLPEYMSDYSTKARPFWVKNVFGEKVGDYNYFKAILDC